MITKINRNFTTLYIVSVCFFLTICLIHFFFPKLEFNKPEYNRGFGIFFNLYCFYLFLILLKLISKIKSKIFKTIAHFINVFFLLVALLNFTIYLMKIDPQIQYYDIEVTYFNKKNKFEKIINQYYVDWKSNNKIYNQNRVYDFGPFRYFIEYKVNTDNLSENWVKTK